MLTGNNLWSDEIFVGLMAQDLLKQPEFAAAVSIGKQGRYRINYQVLGLNMMTLDEWNSLPVHAAANNESELPGTRD